MADTKNITAFLKLIRWCEHYPHEPNDLNYKTMYGGEILTSLADHPHRTVTKWGNTSSAAGAYQITQKTFDEYKLKLGLTDFSPESQDKIAMQIIKEKRASDGKTALDLINEGQIETALTLLTGRWTSLPGGKQSQVKMPDALKKFEEFKASIAN